MGHVIASFLCPLAARGAIELLRLFAMRQPFFLKLSSVSIHRGHLLKLGEKSTPIMIIVRFLSPEPVGWLQHRQPYLGL